MNAILSLFLSLAMLFSGGTLPETADTTSTLTVQDFVMEYDGESYPLGFDFSVSATAAQDGLTLHFEVIDGEGDILLPLTGAISKDGVKFTVSDAGSVYSLSAETLNEMLGLEADDEDVAQLSEYMENYAAILESMQNAKNATLSADAQEAVMNAFYNRMRNRVSEEMEWDFGDGEIPVTHICGSTNMMDVYAFMDDCMAMDIEPLSGMLKRLLDMYNTLFQYVLFDLDTIGVIGGADGPTAVYVADETDGHQPAASWTELLEMLLGVDEEVRSVFEQMEMELDIINGVQDETTYELMSLYMPIDEETGASLSINAESAASEDSSLYAFSMYMDDSESNMGFEVQVDWDGSVENPKHIATDVMILGNEASAYSTAELGNEEEVDEDGMLNSEYVTTTIMLSAETDYDGKLEDTTFRLSASESGVCYVDGEIVDEYESEPFAMDFELDEEMDEAGNLLSAFDIAFSGEGFEGARFTFGTVLSKAAAVDYFAGRDLLELTSDTESSAYNTLSADALGLLSDAMTIAANEDFAAFTSLGSADAIDAVDEMLTDDDGVEYRTDTIIDFDSIEEAKTLYTGIVPDYTAPEGYVLDGVDVTMDGDYMSVFYIDENGEGFFVSYYDYGEENENLGCFLEDGKLIMMDEPIISLSGSEGMYTSADIPLSQGHVSFHFDNELDFETVEQILSGLAL